MGTGADISALLGKIKRLKAANAALKAKKPLGADDQHILSSQR
jgi:hypothetical protein